MSIMKKVKRCGRCGAILQAEDENADGYLSREVLDKTDNRVLLCDECYKESISNYIPQEPTLNKEFLTILDNAVKSNALIVYVIDLFSFEASFINEINKHIANLDVIVMVNKFDLFPQGKKSMTDIKEYVSHRCRVSHLKVKEVFLMDLYNPQSFKKITEDIKNDGYYDDRDVYVIGAKLSGKTTIISNFLKYYKNTTKKPIITFTYPKTSLRVIKIPITENSSIFEVDGFSVDNSIISKVEKPVASMITPKRPIKARKFVMKEGTSIFIGGIARFDFVEGAATTFKLYVAEDVEVRKQPLANAEKVLEEQIEKKTLEPTSVQIRTMKDFDIYGIKVDEKGDRDIGILGLGWVSFTGNDQKLRVVVPKGVSVYSTRAKIK